MSVTVARRRAIVTGGSSGIGETTAIVLAERGYDVAVTYRSGRERAAAVRAQLEARGARGWTAQLDFEQPVAAAQELDRLAERLETVDLLVCNAAISPTVSFLSETPAELARTLAVNFTAPFLAAQAIARRMAARGEGVIVNVTSVLDRVPLAGKAAYCASKAALAMLTQVAALELAQHGVRVVAVAPGHIATPMNFGERDVGEAPAIPTAPLARAGRRREVAEAIAYLASAEGAYVTGTSLLVDGGLLLVSGPQILEQEADHLHGPAYRS